MQGAYLFFNAPAQFYVKCSDCKKYILREDGKPYIDKATELPMLRKEPVVCTAFNCKKISALLEAGINGTEIFDGFYPVCDSLFRSYQTARTFGTLPKTGGIGEQDENVMYLFSSLTLIENGYHEKRKIELAKLQSGIR